MATSSLPGNGNLRKKNMKQYAVYEVTGRYVVEVESNSVEDTIKQSEVKFSEADFGEAQDIDGKIIAVEDEEGNYIYEA